MKQKAITFVTCIYATTAFAHELPNEFKFSAGSETSATMELIINNTHDDGTEIRCALYDEDRNILAVDQTYAQEIATKFIFILGYPARFTSKDVKDYKCVKVD